MKFPKVCIVFLGLAGLVGTSAAVAVEVPDATGSEKLAVLFPAAMQDIRAQMGFPKLPASTTGDFSLVGAVRLSEDELSTYRSYTTFTNEFVEFKENQPSLSSVLEELPQVVSLAFSGTVAKPRLDVFLGRDTDAAQEAKTLELVPAPVRAQVSLHYRIYTKVEINRLVEELGAALSTDKSVQEGLTRLEGDAGIKVAGAAFGGSADGVVVYASRHQFARARSSGRFDSRVVGLSNALDVSKYFGTAVPVALIERGDPVPTQATSITRTSSEGSLVRGGKAMTNGCTTSAVVRDSTTSEDFVLTAAHCVSPGQTTNVGGSAAITNIAECQDVTYPSPYQATCTDSVGKPYRGLDVALMSIPSGTGWFVHQAPGYLIPGTPYWTQGQTYLDATLGSFDLVAGIHNTCVEGASNLKYQGVYNLDARSSCGLTGGDDGTTWQVGDLQGLFAVAIYPQNSVCQGDSGAYIRRPDGYGGSWNGGTLSGINGGGQLIGPWAPPASFCRTSVGPTTGTHVNMYVTSFWKTHLYIKAATGREIWAKTW